MDYITPSKLPNLLAKFIKIFFHNLLNFCRVGRDTFSFITEVGNLCPLLFFLISQGNSLSILLIFSKGKVSVYCFFYCFSVLYFINFCSNVYFFPFASPSSPYYLKPKVIHLKSSFFANIGF